MRTKSKDWALGPSNIKKLQGKERPVSRGDGEVVARKEGRRKARSEVYWKPGQQSVTRRNVNNCITSCKSAKPDEDSELTTDVAAQRSLH